MKGYRITDVRVHPGDSAFLLDDGKIAILYDTGFGFTGEALVQNVGRVLGKRQLDFVFLTHSHYDHALGSAHVKRAYPEARVVAGEYAAKIFSKPSARALMREMDRKAALGGGAGDYTDLVDELRVDVCVSDGDTLRVGDWEFEVLSLPGHTKCSVGYYAPAHKLLLGCETLGVFNGRDDVVPSYLVGYGMTLEALSRVERLEIESILVPHYGLLSGDAARFYLRRARERAVLVAETVRHMLESGNSREEILAWYTDTFYHGYIKEIYPPDAMRLNTGIMIDLLSRE